MRILSFVLLLLAASFLHAQTPADFDGSFEKKGPGGGLLSGWLRWGMHYELFTDTTVSHNGRSALCITPEGKKQGNSFGCSVIGIPVTFSGKFITLSGYLKLEGVKDGSAGLFMRIDGDYNASLGMDNMQQRGIRGTADWKQYSITLPLSTEAKIVYVGAISSGTGKVWADDLHVTVDGKELSKAAAFNMPAAYRDTAFSLGSGITLRTVTPRQLANLEVLGKVWGFLKYYHPAVKSGEYNWDNELFRILPGILQCSTAARRNGVLLAWLQKLKPGAAQRATREDTSAVKIRPDLAWLHDEKELGAPLSAALQQVAQMKQGRESYYIYFAGAGNPVFSNEKQYAHMPYPDAGYRLLALFRYWNSIQYFYPDKHLITEGWNNQLREFIPLFIQAADTAAYQTASLQLISRIHDSHGVYYGQGQVTGNYYRYRGLPLEIAFVENKAVVTKLLSNTTPLQPGDVITRINGKAVTDIVKEALPTTSASNYPTQLRNIAGSLLRTKNSLLPLAYERNGVTAEVTLPTMDITALQTLFAKASQRLSWKLLGDDAGYIYPGRFKNTQMDTVKQAFAHTKGLVIDLRCYPSDNMLTSLAPYLLPANTPFVKFTKGSSVYPGMFTYTVTMSAGKKNRDYYRGKVVILVNAVTQSNAEFVTMALRLAPQAVVLGSTTAGADGNVSTVTFPGGMQTYISGIGVYYPDGRETQRVGIIPDIVMEPTIKGIRENRDELLDKALAIIRSSGK
jgi:C-terminal processing protease CtpA/Prc